MTSTAVTEETEIPQGYKYSWSADSKSELSADEFIAKFKPSLVTDDGTKPWIWMCGPGYESPYELDDAGGAIVDALMKITEVSDKVEAVQNDASIPVRANKKTGAKSKKEVREEIQAEGKNALRDIAQNHRFTIGKWLCYGNNGNIDGLWARIARSIASGPLSKTSAKLAKVSTAKRGEGADSHVICLYLPDIFDETEARNILKILVREHGIVPSGAKPDLYTHIQLDSKHKSGVRSTVWQLKELLSDAEIKALRDEYDASKTTSLSKPKEKALELKDDDGDVAMGQPSTDNSHTNEKKKQSPAAPPKAKPTAKPRDEDKDDDRSLDPFASDEEAEKPSQSQKAEAARRAALFKSSGSGPAKQTQAIPKPKVPKSKAEIAKEAEMLKNKKQETMKGKGKAESSRKPLARTALAEGDTESEEEAEESPPISRSKARGKKRSVEVSDDDEEEEEEEEEEAAKPKAKARRKK